MVKAVAKYRLPSGGHIDRSQLLHFSWGGRTLNGFAGDTLASALLSHGIHFVGRSFKYHRPRGIYTAGVEEPNALVTVGREGRMTPNLRATEVVLTEGLNAIPQNAWPSLDFDLLSINNFFSPVLPSGFYYKTFMRPTAWWHKRYEPLIRRSAGLGRASRLPDPDSYERRYAHADLLIVGGGAAGLAAAHAAGQSGQRVVLVEQDFLLGGSLLARTGETIDGEPARSWLAKMESALGAMENVRVLKNTTCFAAYEHGMWGLLERLRQHGTEQDEPQFPRQRMWWLRAPKSVIAAGAIERPLVFANNDLPGVTLASSAATYANRFAVKPGDRTVVFTNNNSGYTSALSLIEAGVEIKAIVDTRPAPSGVLAQRILESGVTIFPGHGVARARGWHDLHRLRIAPIDREGNAQRGGVTMTCDSLAVSGGWSPVIHLPSHQGAKVQWDGERACFVVAEAPQGMAVVGGAAASFDLAQAIEEGATAGAAAVGAKVPSHGEIHTSRGALEGDSIAWIKSKRGKAFVDLQNDSTAKDLALAIREGYESIEHVKRYTTTGMATDQGKLANVNAIQIVSKIRGLPIDEIGVTTFRAPYTPTTLAAFAGCELDDFLQPERVTVLHDWAVRRGAEFEPVGQWMRAWYYPQGNEDMHQAVQRESAAVRQAVGFMDASTLGKIEVCGKDAAEFLNRVYTNGMLKMPHGACRYGLMLNEEGTLFDDGVISRVSDDRFFISTTTGGAPRVLAWLELWLQTEWTDLQVWLTSVSEQWAALALNGPKARKVLQPLTDIDLGDEAFPYMRFREGQVCGAKARILRVSFTGELGYEVHIAPEAAESVAEALMEQGAPYGITPYGTESMHLLRAEKGFIIAGQDNEGTTTPDDLGLSGLCSKKKDYIGRRGTERAGMLREDRKQLVGLLPENETMVLPEGVPLGTGELKPPFAILGHVTSSYMSPTLKRGFAMALLRRGHKRHGETISAWVSGATVPCKIVPPMFLDPEGARLRGEDA